MTLNDPNDENDPMTLNDPNDENDPMTLNDSMTPMTLNDPMTKMTSLFLLWQAQPKVIHTLPLNQHHLLRIEQFEQSQEGYDCMNTAF